MSEFPQPGELEQMAATVAPPWTDRCIILTYGESVDVDGAPLTVYSEGDEIPCVWEPSTRATGEDVKDRYTVSTSEWKVTVAADVEVTRRDMVKLTARFGSVLPVPPVGAVYGDPVPDIGCQQVIVREVTQ
jgi:hypothetical protein